MECSLHRSPVRNIAPVSVQVEIKYIVIRGIFVVTYMTTTLQKKHKTDSVSGTYSSLPGVSTYETYRRLEIATFS
jgi:hypothetical protein